MILPCRILRTCDRNRVDSLAFVFLFAVSFLLPVGEGMAQEALTAASEAAGFGWLPAVPIQITAGVDMGYDDHVTGNNSTTSSSGQSSFFARENLVLTYARPTERTQVSLIGVGRFEQFFDLGTDDKNGNVTLSITRRSRISNPMSARRMCARIISTRSIFSRSLTDGLSELVL